MNSNSKKTEAQLVRYIYTVIHNTSVNYYLKKGHRAAIERTLPDIVTKVESAATATEDDSIERIKIQIQGVDLYFDDPKLRLVLQNLKESEQILLIDKYFLGMSDQAIAAALHTTQQNISKKRNRLLKRILRRVKS